VIDPGRDRGRLENVVAQALGANLGLLDLPEMEGACMSGVSRRLLAGPAVLAGVGCGLFVAVPLLSGWLHLSPDGAGAMLLHHAIGIWMWLALAWLAARCLDVLLRRVALVSRNGVPYPRLLTDLMSAILFAAAAMTILLFVFDQPATGLVTVSSVVIAVIGFALRNVISDLFSGIALSVDHPYRIGDWIETTQSAGRVSEITWRTTRLIDRNGFAIIVPNGLIAGQRLINYGDGERDYRTALRVPLDATLPVGRAKRILLSGALDAGREISGLAPDVLLAEYNDGAAVYVVRFRVPDFGREAACRDTVASRVLNALHCAGHTINRVGLSGPIPVPWQSSREALLGQVNLFRGFDAAERAELATKMRSREAEAGQMVVRQGDSGDFLYVLGEGLLDVEITRDGAAQIRDRIAPGEVFGEISLLTGQKRTASVIAALDSVVYEIHREDLDPIVKRRPEIAEGLAAAMAKHQARNDSHFEAPVQTLVPTRDDLLARLRLLFGL
jgi:small-conductance mechanosensitive channel/CRP-like cAMP-binding protein